MLSKREYLKEWRRKNAAYVRAYRLRRAPIAADKHQRTKYGITLRQRNTMVRLQGYRCAGCREKKQGHWHTDHCHRTKKVRGILCFPCNALLGFSKDRPSTLRRLADYLEK